MIALAVQDQSQVSQTRRRAAEMAERQGFGDTDSGRVALVATELATNVLKHGRGGEVLVGSYGEGPDSGIELIALDRGPGIANVVVSFADGYSTAGTAGKGLGAVVRQSHFVDIASWPGNGTAIIARLKQGTPSKGFSDASPTGAVSVPKLGEDVSEEVKRSGQPKPLAPMTPFERKIVHDAIAAAGLRSESEGEEPERYVVVFPS